MSDAITSTTSAETILELIQAKELKSAVEKLLAWVDPEIADLLIRLEKAEQILVYRALPRQRAADVSYLEPQDQDSLLTALTDADTRSLLANLNPDDRTALLQELPATVTRRLMQLLGQKTLWKHGSCSVIPKVSGRLMTLSTFVCVPSGRSSKPSLTCGNSGETVRFSTSSTSPTERESSSTKSACGDSFSPAPARRFENS